MEDGNVSSDDLSSEDFGDPESRVFDMKVPGGVSGGERRFGDVEKHGENW
jgi:hypothetical protein